MVELKLSRSFIGEHLSIVHQEALLDLSKTLVSSGIIEASSDDIILSNACAFSLPISFWQNLENCQNFIRSLSPHFRDKILSTLGCESIEDCSSVKELQKAIRGTFKIDTTQPNIASSEPTSTFKNISPPEVRFKDLKPYQTKLSEQVWQHLNLSTFSKCVLQMPTGTGKTRTSIDVICRFFNECEDGIQIVWLCNTEELADQALQTFIDTYSFLANKTVLAKNCMRNTTSLPADSSQFLVASIQSVGAKNIEESKAAINKLGVNLDRLKAVILDEAHIATAPTYRNALEALTEDGAALLGLTATPGRKRENDSSLANLEFAQFFNQNVFKLQFEGKDTIEELMSRQIMSRSYSHPIEGSTVESLLSEKEIERMTIDKVIPKRLINLISADNSRNATIISLLSHLLKSNKKIIYFGTSVEQSQLVSNSLSLLGHSSAHVDGSSGSSRSLNIHRYRNGDIQCLCNYGVLSTGFDDPKTDVVFIARITNSIVLYSQMIGRGLRGEMLGGTQKCDIYTVIDNITDLPENKDIYNYFQAFFERHH